MNIASAIAFDTAEREYNDAWNAPSSTRFELPPVDANKVLKERYRVSPEQTLTNANGLCGQNSAWILGIRASFQRDNLGRHF